MTEQDGELIFEAEVDLGGLDPCSVRVELYAGPQDGKPAFRQEMHPTAGPGTAPDWVPDLIYTRHKRRPRARRVISRPAFFRITHWHCRRKFGESYGKDERGYLRRDLDRRPRGYKELKYDTGCRTTLDPLTQRLWSGEIHDPRITAEPERTAKTLTPTGERASTWRSG